MSWPDFIAWLFEQHNDHRIPLVKGALYAMLTLSGFDFRTTLLINLSAAVACSVMLFDICRRWRGRWHFGDLIVTLIMMSFGFNVFSWGFSLQFAATILFAVGFAWLMFKGRPAAAYVTLLADALTGLGGLVIATIVCGAMLLPEVNALRSRQNWPRSDVAYPASLFVFCLFLWLTWTPSSASGGTDIARALTFIYEFGKSSLAVSALHGGLWKAIALGALTFAGLYFALRELARSKLTPAERALCATLIALLGMMVAIAIGRSGANPWRPGLEMHYGYLATPVPILCWLLISRSVLTRFVHALGAGLLALFAVAFVENVQWRIGQIHADSAKTTEVAYLIQSCTPASEIVDAHLPQLYYVDTPRARIVVREGIERLRRERGNAACPT